MRRIGWKVLTFVLLLTALVMPGAAWAQGGTLDQSNDVPTQYYLGTIYQQAQTFTAGRDGVLDRIELKGYRVPQTGQVTIQIMAVDQNGAPTGSVLGNGSFDNSALPLFDGTGGDWVSVSISPGVQVQAGVQYAIVKPAGNPFLSLWSLSAGNTYVPGAGSPDEFGQPYDYLFRTYVLTTPTTPTCNGLEATIYVKDGTIVGGPSDGAAYTGTLAGTSRNDVIVGTDAADTIAGKAGNDTICGLGGKDTIDGAAGNDVMIGGPGADKLNGASGTDSTPDYNASEGDKRTNVP